MTGWIYPSVEEVHEIHAVVLAAHGGMDGVRDQSLLESALAAPQATAFGEPLFKDPVEIAAAYLFYICQNHPFLDGNKRTALSTCLVFLRANGLAPFPDSSDWEALVLDVAASRLDRDQTTARLRRLVRKRKPKRRAW